MIITKLSGGLGNQMFQYAAGRVLAEKNNTILKLDISEYGPTTFRKYGLKHFNIQGQIASPLDIFRLSKVAGTRTIVRKYLGEPAEKRLIKIFAKLKIKDYYFARHHYYDPNKPAEKLLHRKVLSQRFFHFDPEFFDCPEDALIVGSWISYKYFRRITNMLRDEFRVTSSLTQSNKALVNQIEQTNSVSVHLRRTDKVVNPAFEPTSVDYCTRAMRNMGRRIEAPFYFIFSDDIQWAKNNLKCTAQARFVDVNDDAHSYEDLRLMTLCKHNIIAASSFSWWAAYLNPNPIKIVISPDPRLWINRDNFFTEDIIPLEWEIIKT